MKKKICLFCETWESGGIESFLTNVLSHMDLSRFEVDLVAEKIKDSVFTPKLEKLNINFHELSGHQHSLVNERRFRSILLARRYDVLHLNLFHAVALRYAFIAKNAGVPRRIAHSHNTNLRRSVTKELKLVAHTISKNYYSEFVTDFWACSSKAAKFLFSESSLQKKPFRFIPNGIDTERFRFSEGIREKVRKEMGLSDAFIIGNVGRLCYQKNQIFLVKLLPEILKQYPNAVLILIGEGPDKDRLLAEAQKNGVERNILLLGTTSMPEKYYCAMDVFMFPSHFEGLGIAAVEAQCAGLPVLCAEGVPPEVQCSQNIKFLPINGGYKPWLTGLKVKTSLERRRGIESVRAKGFDIHNVSFAFEEAWEARN